MTWDELACWMVLGAVLGLLAYGFGQLLVIWASGGV